uniref:Rhodanese domain-containing protein n=1 Tax=Heterorhabditis bacteriophora TaxID=37862 RepID=A0A1I7XAR0_HETBA
MASRYQTRSDYTTLPYLDSLKKCLTPLQILSHPHHFNRTLLSRNYFETPILESARKTGTTLVIYGHRANVVTATLHERGYKAIYLTGNLQFYRTCYPAGLTSKSGPQHDIVALKNAFERIM